MRRLCLNRTYEYYLPAATLGLASPDGAGPGDAERLRLFRAALTQYVGNRPFHNFAGVRSQYVKSDKGSKAIIEKWAAQEAERRRVREAAAAEAGPQPEPAPEAAAAEGEESSEEVQQEEGEVNGQRVYVQQVRWLEDPDPKDPVVMSHYRRVISFTADDPRPLVEGGRARGGACLLCAPGTQLLVWVCLCVCVGGGFWCVWGGWFWYGMAKEIMCCRRSACKACSQKACSRKARSRVTAGRLGRTGGSPSAEH